MKIYYRISDKSYPKIKLPGATKRVCLENLIAALKPCREELTIIADNCGPGTVEWLNTLNFEVQQTNLGNAGALLHALTLAKNFDPDDGWPTGPFYFVEDDYLHHPDRAWWLMHEGPWCANSASFSGVTNHYWTLYDHPDKYGRYYGYHEVGKVTRTKSGHWKQSVSTTMTFAVDKHTLHLDYPIWEKFLRQAMEKGHGHPPDHEIFKALGEIGHELFVAIPGAACHVDLTPYGTLGRDEIDKFAVEMMYSKLHKEVVENPQGASLMVDMFGGTEPSSNLTNLGRLAAVHEALTSHLDVGV